MALVSIAEAAEALGVSPHVLREQVRAGRIPAYVVGPRSLRVDVAEARRAVRVGAETEGGVGSAVGASNG